MTPEGAPELATAELPVVTEPPPGALGVLRVKLYVPRAISPQPAEERCFLPGASLRDVVSAACSAKGVVGGGGEQHLRRMYSQGRLALVQKFPARTLPVLPAPSPAGRQTLHEAGVGDRSVLHLVVLD